MALVSKPFADIITFTRASTATYFDSAGVLQSAAIDAPRFDYDPSTLAARGFLIEEARTNGVIWSESFRTRTLTVTITAGTFTNGETVTATGGGTGTYIAADSTTTSFAIFNGSGTFSGTLTGGTSGATATISASTGAWTLAGSTITANTTNAPTGTAIADKLVEDTSTGTHRVFQTVSGTTNTNPYTISVFAKGDTRTALYIGLLEGTTFSRQGNAVFDLSAGTVVSAAGGSGGATGGSATIQNVGNGWYRCTYTLTLGGTDTNIFFDFVLRSGGSISYTGDGTSGLFIWGAQLEAGAFPTSYIPTTTIQVTRSADVARVNTLSPWFNQTEGTVYAEYVRYTNATSGRIATFSDGTASNQIRINGSVSTNIRPDWQVLTGGSVQANVIGAAEVAVNAIGKTAGRYATNDFQQATNGTLGSAGTSGTVPSVTTLSLGGNEVAGNLNGWLRRLTFYPRGLSNVELQSITTP